MHKTGMLFLSLGLLLLALRRLLTHRTMQEAEAVVETMLDPAGVEETSADPPPEQLVLDDGLPTWQPLT
jgi:hypothetical protein